MLVFYPRSAVTWFSQCSGKFRPRGILLQTGVETDWQSTAIDAYREITLSFRFVSISLRLTVAPLRPFRAVEPATASAGPSIDLEAPSSESLVVDQFGISVALEEQVLVAEGPVPLAALPFDFLQSYIGRLPGIESWDCGLPQVAGHHVWGIWSLYSIPEYYLHHPEVSFYSRFVQHIGRGGSFEFDTTTVCHSFPTQAEGDVYLIGVL